MTGIAPTIGGGGADTSLEEIMIAGLGLKTWNYPPHVGLNTSSPTTQLIYAIPVPYRVGQVVTNICFEVAIAAAGTNPTGIFVGIADISGKMLAQSGNLAASAFQATGMRELALSAPYTIPADGLYYHVLLVNGTWGTTQPTLNRGVALGAFGVPNGKFVAATGGSGQTTLPANGSSITPAATSALTLFTGST